MSGKRQLRLAPLVLFILGATIYSSQAAAQEMAYSADSLMAAFESGSKERLKGSEITFSDVIAEVESRKSRVVFKSSGNDKVICELVSPSGNGGSQFLAGHSVTVSGRIRGRGVLGNVTLDGCRVVDAVAVDPPREVVSDDSATAEHPLPEIETPVEEPLPTRDIKPTRAQPGPVSLSKKRMSPVPEESIQAPEKPPQIIREATYSPDPEPPYAFYAFVVALVCLAVLTIGKLRPALAVIAARLRPSPSGSASEETRRAALEALLSAEKRKR